MTDMQVDARLGIAAHAFAWIVYLDFYLITERPSVFGEYLDRHYTEAKRRPRFVVDRVMAHQPDAARPHRS
jgi:hypothetical protein